MKSFRNRQEAGRALAVPLAPYASDLPIVIALPRGGVPVGYEIARELRAPLEVWIVRKIGVPWHPELGVGAVSEDGYVYLARGILEHVGLSEAELARAIEQKRAEIADRVTLFRGARPRPSLLDRTVILVDDGIATGGTVLAVVRAIREEHPRELVLAVPVVQRDSVTLLAQAVDRVVSLVAPAYLRAIGLWYEDFTQLTDEECSGLLERARLEYDRTWFGPNEDERNASA
ncbi:MAG TPA: phosphoribosyltransferase family protein [Kofleriaceae bacterium]|nr:phosphoribosyltransferase family protein [Kofleriaceae bacterium]